MLRNVSSGAAVDTAAIAAAVAAELTIPTVAEIAAEVDAQGGAAAAITAASLPSAADVATAVGAQAACAAAITAAGLPTAADVATLQSAVDLLPADADITTLVGAVIDAKTDDIAAAVALEVPDAGAIGDLLSPPSSGPFASGTLSGNTSYTIAAAVPGSYYVLYGFEITAVGASNIKLQWKNTGGTALGEEHTVPSTGQFTVAPGSRASYKTIVGEGLALAEPSGGASLTVTYWGEYKT